jgi:hypothetical protein
MGLKPLKYKRPKLVVVKIDKIAINFATKEYIDITIIGINVALTINDKIALTVTIASTVHFIPRR